MQLRPGLVSVAVLTAELLAAKPHDKLGMLVLGPGFGGGWISGV